MLDVLLRRKKSTIPTQRGVAPDARALALKAARSQAFRYGYQIRQLEPDTPQQNAVAAAWYMFIAQFGDGSDGTQVTIDYLMSEYKRGVRAASNDDDDEMLFV